jgi:phospholipase/lecithinase/hemolysin
LKKCRISSRLRTFKGNSDHVSSSWPGWDGIDSIFVFGDSYSRTGFDASGDQPNPSNPFGNPRYPGPTSSNGENWIQFLATKHNESFVKAYNFAFGGATVDSELVKPFLPSVLSMKQQVEEEFLPRYPQNSSHIIDYDHSSSTSPSWTSKTALFAMWIGINDVDISFQQNNASLHAAIFHVYSNLVQQLYTAGARNFLFMNVPPLERYPRTLAKPSPVQKLEKTAVDDFNCRVSGLVHDLTAQYTGVTVKQFDVHRIFSQVIDAPNTFEETKAYKNVTKWCPLYGGGTPERDTFYEDCGIPVDEYLWLNDLHPTYPIHNAIAHQVKLQLETL